MAHIVVAIVKLEHTQAIGSRVTSTRDVHFYTQRASDNEF